MTQATTNTAVDRLLAAAAAVESDSCAPLVQAPSQIYHFTDAPGAIGILSAKSLRASHAGCLNDASEIAYGINVYCAALEAGDRGSSDVRRAFCATVLKDLRGHTVRPESHRVDLDPFVTSFCGGTEKSAQWMHYGRAGNGYALGFDPARLPVRGARLVKVVYDEAQQHACAARMVARLQESLLSAAAGPTWHVRDRLRDAAAYVAAATIRAKAVEFKHPSFREENEWRLVTWRIHGETIAAKKARPPKVEYRAVGARLVPYLEPKHRKRAFPLRSIVVGFSADYAAAQTSLRLMLQAAELEGIDVSRSAVPIR